MAFWIILIVIAIIGACTDSGLGKFILGAAVVACGLLLLKWITGMSLFVTLAKVCAIAIVVIIIWLIVSAIVDC